jgi:hypothetical protein
MFSASKLTFFLQRLDCLGCDDHGRLIFLQLTGIDDEPELLCKCTAVWAVERKLIDSWGNVPSADVFHFASPHFALGGSHGERPHLLTFLRFPLHGGRCRIFALDLVP